MFDKILIANRGEIACRIIKTARKMGIKTVAVYSDADKNALHVGMADEAVHIGEAHSAKSYLRADRIIRACKKTNARAVHPGYGFLSENKDFQIALRKAGITFIGPNARAIESMGDKITSKRLADKAGVSTVPGYMGVIRDADEAIRISHEIGYPVMLKASAGGGGKGMRIAHNDAEAHEGFERATSEAKSSFGDGRVFVEKFIEQPRHIEIQVLADRYGNCIYVGERECSIQRRHQKVIEEAPSPLIDEKTRQAMGKQAVKLAKAVDYLSAGTVEFIVDNKRNFYFLEMNTRLQVEHPITELVTGLDLVEWMIRIADGEKLSIRQADIKINGWAMESRIYAEDPYRNFLPSTGRLVTYRQPKEGKHVRVDTGAYEGGDVSMFYDPMIAKLCTWGKTRKQAIAHMRDALDRYYIRGISHNIPFLASVMGNKRFGAGRLTTNFIAEEYPDGFSEANLSAQDSVQLCAVAALIHRAYSVRSGQISGSLKGHERRLSNAWVVDIAGKHRNIEILDADVASGTVRIGRHKVIVTSDWTYGEPLFLGKINKQSVCVQVDRIGIGYRLFHKGAQVDATIYTAREAELAMLMPQKVPADTSRFLLSPMPGLLVSVEVSEGQEVKAGETLAIVEAMKMENVLRAERDGTVKRIPEKAGASLAVDQVIMEFV